MNTDNNPLETPEQVSDPEASQAVETPKKRVSRTRKKTNTETKEEKETAKAARRTKRTGKTAKIENQAEKTEVIEPVQSEAPVKEDNPVLPEVNTEKAEIEALIQEVEAAKKEENAQEIKKEPASKTEPAKRPENGKKIKKIEKPIPVIKDFCDLSNLGGRIPMLSDQQIQQLTFEDAEERFGILETILATVLNYDIILSDTNIWLELLVGHSSSHSDPRVNARLQFERQLEFLSKMMKRIGGKFMMMSETYEEIDRFASQQEPTNYKDADWSDEVLCRNVAARLAKRLILSQQKENRLRIEAIGSESHHAAFADPAIIRRTVEFFSKGKKVLLLTNDASVGIRSLGMCDDLQRTNDIDDATWRTVYEPQRPMVLNMDDLKLLDNYTRQYHYLMVAANRQWMQDIPMREPVALETPLKLWMEGFRAGDRHERRSDRIEQQRKEEREKREKAERERQERERQEKAEREKREKQEREKREKAEREKAEQQRKNNERKARNRRTEKSDSEPEAIVLAPEATETDAAVAENPAMVSVPDAPVTAEAVPDHAEQVAAEADPVGSFGDTTEMMDLITPQATEGKPRSSRSRRRSSGTRRRPNKPAAVHAE